MRADKTPPEKRLADNMLDYNPAATDALVRLMLGALVPGREGGLLNARLRYFDPVRKRAGVPEDVAALVSALDDRRTVVTLVNVNPATARTVVVQGGGYAEHQIESATVNGRTVPVGARDLTVRLAVQDGGLVYIHSRAGRFLVLEPSTGRLVASADLPPPSFVGSPVILQDRILVPCRGAIACIDKPAVQNKVLFR